MTSCCPPSLRSAVGFSSSILSAAPAWPWRIGPMRCRLAVSGHIHVSSVSQTVLCRLGSALVVQAGTATSTRAAAVGHSLYSDRAGTNAIDAELVAGTGRFAGRHPALPENSRGWGLPQRLPLKSDGTRSMPGRYTAMIDHGSGEAALTHPTTCVQTRGARRKRDSRLARFGLEGNYRYSG